MGAILDHIKYSFIFLLAFLLGVQNTYSKIEFISFEAQTFFLTEQIQNFISLEKKLQPNIGFLKEKNKFVVSEGVSSQNQHGFFEQNLRYLVNLVDDVFYVGKHTNITPRPTNVQSHHGVNSVWMKAKYSNYSANKAPSVYMLNNPNHNATRGIFNTWAKETRIKQGITKVDYSKVIKDDILDLTKKQFDAADTPQLVRDEYYKLWDDYLKTLTP